jgi:hypothetical protein
MIAAAKIEHARAVRIEGEIARRSIKLKRVGAELIGPCPKCGGRDRFGVHTKKQLWHCRNCGVGGNDAISLVRHLDGCGFVGAIDTLAGDGATNQTPPAKREERDVYKDDQSKASKAAWLWSQRKPITEGTPPWLYLRKRAYRGPIPATLGYLPPRGLYPAAMIAAFGMTGECDEPGIIGVPKSVTGVHLTRLTLDGNKAPNAAGEAKLMRGVCKGAPIAISPPNNLMGMAVTEGIEDGLTVYKMTGLGVWAAGSGTLMPALASLIPDYTETVTVYAHDDNTGRSNAINLALAPSRPVASKCGCRGFDRWPKKRMSTTFYVSKAKRPSATFTMPPNLLMRAIQNSRTARQTVDPMVLNEMRRTRSSPAVPART